MNAEVSFNKNDRQGLKRRGDVERCPACGSHVHAEAYHCPTCHQSFCYHCRARLLPSDTQLECTNQACDYYGKLACRVCNAAMEKHEPPAVYTEPEDGYWPVLLLLMFVIAPIVWVRTSFLWALFCATVAFVAGGYLLHRFGVNVFGKERRVEHPRKSRIYTCICCHQPVKELRLETML